MTPPGAARSSAADRRRPGLGVVWDKHVWRGTAQVCVSTGGSPAVGFLARGTRRLRAAGVGRRRRTTKRGHAVPPSVVPCRNPMPLTPPVPRQTRQSGRTGILAGDSHNGPCAGRSRWRWSPGAGRLGPDAPRPAEVRPPPHKGVSACSRRRSGAGGRWRSYPTGFDVLRAGGVRSGALRRPAPRRRPRPRPRRRPGRGSGTAASPGCASRDSRPSAPRGRAPPRSRGCCAPARSAPASTRWRG